MFQNRNRPAHADALIYRGDEPVRFLHIGKTGGSAVRDLVNRDTEKRGTPRVVVMPHSCTLAGLAEEFPKAPIAFCVRDPLERAVSGFISRQRRGQPRTYSEWRDAEAEAFGRFNTVDALGRGLWHDDPEALKAARAIRHVGRMLEDYLGGLDTLRRLADRIIFIGAQPHLDADIHKFQTLAGLDPDLCLPTDPVVRHDNPDRSGYALSQDAERGLARFVADDMPIYTECLALRERIFKARGVT